MARPKNKNVVVDNEKFYQLIKLYHETKDPRQSGNQVGAVLAEVVDESGEVRKKREHTNYVTYEEIGMYIMRLGRHLLKHPWFNRYDDNRKEEFLGDALLYMIKAVENFDYKNRTNAHAYFTTICFNSFRQVIKNHQKIDKATVRLDSVDNYWE